MKTPAINDSAIFLLSRLLILSQAFFYFDLFWFFSIPKSFPPPREHGSGYSFSRSLKQMRSSSEKKRKKRRVVQVSKRALLQYCPNCKCKKVLNIIKLQKTISAYGSKKNKKPQNNNQKKPPNKYCSIVPRLEERPLPPHPPFFLYKKKKKLHNIYNFKSHKNVKQTKIIQCSQALKYGFIRSALPGLAYSQNRHLLLVFVFGSLWKQTEYR